MALHNLNISRAQQSLSPGNRVELYTLDLTPPALGLDPSQLPPGGKLFFSPSSVGGADIRFGGQTYTSTPIHAEGFEVSGQGSLPQPLLRIANINNVAGSIAATYKDLIGAILTRVVTMRQFLDDGPTPDASAAYPPTVWEVIQKNKQNKVYIEWKCASLLDQQGLLLPRRQAWKNTCTWPYRVWSPTLGAFDYTNVEGCSYTGTDYFDAFGNRVLYPSQDVCSQDQAGCKLRFGPNATLPFGGFPGLIQYASGG